MRSMTFPLMKMNFRSLKLRSGRYVRYPKRGYKPLSHFRPVNRNPRPRQPPLSPHRRKQNRLRVVPRRLSQLMRWKKTEIDLTYVTLTLMFPILARDVLLPRLLSECCPFLCACCRYYDNTICADIALSSRKRLLHAPRILVPSIISLLQIITTETVSGLHNLPQETIHYTDK